MGICAVEIVAISVLLGWLQVPLKKSESKQIAVRNIVQDGIAENLQFLVVAS